MSNLEAKYCKACGVELPDIGEGYAQIRPPDEYDEMTGNRTSEIYWVRYKSRYCINYTSITGEYHYHYFTWNVLKKKPHHKIDGHWNEGQLHG